MSEEAVAVVATKKKVSKPQKVSTHPKYSEMVQQAINGLKERGGSSRQAILKYIMKNFNLSADEKVVNQHLKMALRAGAKNNTFKQSKGTGAAGSFRLGEEAKKENKKAPAKANKPKSVVKKAAKKPKTPKKTGDSHKATAKKDNTPKKTTKSTKANKPAGGKAKIATTPKTKKSTTPKTKKSTTPQPKNAAAKPKKPLSKPTKKPASKATKPATKATKTATKATKPAIRPKKAAQPKK